MTQPSNDRLSALAPPDPDEFAGPVSSSVSFPKEPMLPANPTPRPFRDDLIALRGMALRNRLMRMPLDSILGVPLTSPKPIVLEAVAARRASLDRHPDAKTDSAHHRISLGDCHRIVQAVYEVTLNPRDVRAWHTRCREYGERVAFRDFVPFETTLHDADTAARRERLIREAVAVLPAEETPDGGVGAVRMSTEANELLSSVEAVVERAEARRRTGAAEDVQATTQSGVGAAKGITEAVAAQIRRRGSARLRDKVSSSFAAVEPSHFKGDAKRGDIRFHVGDAKTGVLTTLPVFGVVLVALAGVVLGTRFDQFEGNGTPAGLVLPLLRAALLVLGALVGVRFVRGESLSRLGFAPLKKPALIAGGAAVALGALCAVALPYATFSAPASMGLVLALVLVRAVTESLFFDGYLHRALLVEFDRPLVPHIVTMACYGLFVNTYRFFWDPTGDAPIAGALRYAALVALPAAFVFYRTRAWWVAAIVRFAALAGAAWVAVSAAATAG